MSAIHTENSATSESTAKNPYNTRRKSVYFSPTTHSPTTHDAAAASPAPPTTSSKHAAHPSELNPRSPKRVKRQLHVDGAFTPPPSPPTNAPPAVSHTTAAPEVDTLAYDEEDDPVINAIIHVLQLSENAPLSTRDLSSSILQYRLCSLDSPNPSSVVSSRITSHLKRRAAEKPPREPLLTRSESENGRTRTEYKLKHPDLVTDRSPLYADIKIPVEEEKVLRMTPASKLNILSSDPLGEMSDSDEYDSEDISNRSPDRPTLFDPPNGVAYSPDHEVFDVLGSSMMDIDVPTGIKLDFEFYGQGTPSVPLDNLTPPSEEISYPNTPLREVFSSRATPIDPDTESTIPSPPAEVTEQDDPQSPHSGAQPELNPVPASFFDNPLIYQETGEEMYIDEEDDEVRVVEMRTEQHKQFTWINEEFTWEEKRVHLPSPEKVGMDELEEWLEGI